MSSLSYEFDRKKSNTLKIKAGVSVGFKNVSQMLSTFTEKRWDLIAALRENGAMSIAELARTVQRDYKNVHNDVERLMQWLAIEKDEQGKIFSPYDEIIVDVYLPKQKAA